MALVQALLGRVGAAAGGGHHALLGARQGGGRHFTAGLRTPPAHAPNRESCRGGRSARPVVRRLHLLQHERSERVPHGLRWRGAARGIRASVRTVQRDSTAAAHGHQPENRDLPRSTGGRDSRHVQSREHERRSDRRRASRDQFRGRDEEYPLRSTGEGRARRRGAWPQHLRLGDAARAGRIAAARFRGALQAARVLERRDRSLRRRERHVFQNQRVAAGDRLSGGPRARRCRRAARARTRRASRDALFRRREGTSRCTTVRSSRVRGGGRHGRGAGGGGARTIAPGVDRERAALLPLRDRRSDPE